MQTVQRIPLQLMSYAKIISGQVRKRLVTRSIFIVVNR